MATLLPNFMYIGSMSNVSAYKRHDSDKIIIRTKGGPSKDKINTSPSFEALRKRNKEFGGRSAASRRILLPLEYLKPITDYNIAGPLNSLLRPIQELDTKNSTGKRDILISRNPKLLEGFNINKRHPFDRMIRNPVDWFISKKNFRARIQFPALIPGINFLLPDGHFPVYQLVAVLAVIPDFFCEELKYKPADELTLPRHVRVMSEWFSVSAVLEMQQLELQLPFITLPDSFSLMLAAGVRFGRYNAMGDADPVKYIGCGKIAGMA